MSGNLHEDVKKFHCCRRHKFVIKGLLCDTRCCLTLTVTCNSTKHTDHILEFPQQQWVRERATVLRYTYKGKGKGRLWVLQHCCLEAYCTLTRMSSFIHLQRRCTDPAA